MAKSTIVVEIEALLPFKKTLDFFIKLIKDTKDGKSDEELSNQIQSFIGSNLITKTKN